MKIIELLAPAKDFPTALAAVNAGADAIYMGGPAYSARSAAHNSPDDIAKAVDYAHTFGARVYIALNTLLFDSELSQVETIIREVYNCGVDGLIIQDLGIVTLDLPPLPLIASTQCHITTPEKARFLQDIGFQRLILERSLSLEEVRSIHEAVSIELEAFVHGSICIGNSGQCYLSYALGGRSGNRGDCAQPCRLSYQMLDRHHNPINHPRYWLSPKDMCQIENLEAMIDAGITSFKIEGRLKDTAYVTNVVSAYRQKLDTIIEKHNHNKASLGTVTREFSPNLAKSFNRGFTSYWVQGKNSAVESVLSLYTQKSIGEPIGQITFANHTFFLLDRPHNLVAGDGICYLDSKKNLHGTRINSVKEGKIFPDDASTIRQGYFIYRNHDATFTRFLDTHPLKRTIPITITIQETANGLRLTATDPVGITAERDILLHKQYADNSDLAQETFQRQFSRLNTTPYRATTILFQWTRPLFVPIGTLNEWRRNLIDDLHTKRLSAYTRKHTPHHRPDSLDTPLAKQDWDFTLNILNTKARQLYESYGFTIQEHAAESGMDLHGRRVITTKTCLRLELGDCAKHPHYQGIKISPPLIEPFYLKTERALLRLDFDCTHCEMHVYLVSHKT